MKKFLSMVLTVSMLLGIGVPVFAVGREKVTVTLDNSEIVFPDAQPFIDARDRTLVPIRFVSEAMGADVDWENETQTAVIRKDGDTITYKIGDMKAFLNGEMHVFDTYGILKEDRTFVPLRFISEMLSCGVDWDGDTMTVLITSPGEVVKFPEPKLTMHFPAAESDRRLFWITLDNYRDFERDCPNYEFRIEFKNSVEFNAFEQDEGAINGWQKYNRDNFVTLTNSGNTIVDIRRAYYTTRENAKTFSIADGDTIDFELTVHRKCSDESKTYSFSEILKMPYPLEKAEE